MMLLIGVCLHPSSHVQAIEISLQNYVILALSQSDAALDLTDTATLSGFAIDTAEHAFDMRVIPLTTLGVVSGAGTQVMGLELQQKTTFGTDVSVGLSASHLTSTEFVVSNSHSMQSYIRLSQGLFRRWGERYNHLGLSKAQLQAERKGYESARSRQEIILSAVRHYHNLLLAARLVTTVDQAFTRSQEHLEIAKSRHQAGLVSKVDVYRAELAVLNAQSTKREKQRAQERARDAFHEQLGMDSQRDYRPQDIIIRMIPIIPENWPNTLPEHHPDWQAHLIDIEVADLDQFKLQRDLLPDLSLNISAAKRGSGENFPQATNMNTTDWSIQLQLHSSLDSFSEEQSIDRDQIHAVRLQRQGSSLKRRIMRDAQHAIEDLISEDQRLAIATAKKRQASMALELANIRYERGLSNNIALLDAEGAYSEAKTDILRTRAGYNEKAVNMAYTLGILTAEWLALSLQKDISDPQL
ncbi:MAG: TolC family protein [Mariprofundaceae bacterium]